LDVESKSLQAHDMAAVDEWGHPYNEQDNYEDEV
jgi:hypothetical protein